MGCSDEKRKILWAPWRSAYLHGGPKRGCIFCEAATAEEMLPDNLVLWRGNGIFTMMNRFPYAGGHLMVCPNRHLSDLEALTDDEALALMRGVRRSMLGLRRRLKPEGFNVGINIGEVAGAGFADHLHIHIVPRWNGDYNFMPVLADVKVISEHLLETYHKLREEFDHMQMESNG
jgi:ATP adenylyltransferase